MEPQLRPYSLLLEVNMYLEIGVQQNPQQRLDQCLQLQLLGLESDSLQLMLGLQRLLLLLDFLQLLHHQKLLQYS